MNINQAIDAFLLFTVLTREPKAARRYSRNLYGFRCFTGDQDLSFLGFELIRAYVRVRLDYQDEFPRGQFTALRMFFQWCKRQGLVKGFPAPEIQFRSSEHPMLG